MPFVDLRGSEQDARWTAEFTRKHASHEAWASGAATIAFKSELFAERAVVS